MDREASSEHTYIVELLLQDISVPYSLVALMASTANNRYQHLRLYLLLLRLLLDLLLLQFCFVSFFSITRFFKSIKYTKVCSKNINQQNNIFLFADMREWSWYHYLACTSHKYAYSHECIQFFPLFTA